MINRLPYEVSLDFNERNTISKRILQQGDRYTNSFKLNMYIDGIPYSMIGTDVSIVYESKNGEVSLQTSKDVEKPVIISENTIEFTILNRVLTHVGNVKMQVVVSDAVTGMLLTSQRFEFHVNKSIDIDNAIIEEPSFSILMELLGKVNTFVEGYEEILEAEADRIQLYDNMLLLQATLDPYANELIALKNRISVLEEAKTKTYGVRRVLGATTPILERLDDAVGLVANADLDLTKNVKVRNDFDDIYPWSHMRKCIVTSTGRVVYEEEVGYSTAVGDWMVEVPDFYIKHTHDGVHVEYKISGFPLPGYTKIDSFKIARFKTSEVDGVHVSRPQEFPKVLMNRTNFRTNAVSKGENWFLEDLIRNYAINVLYKVEFANLNSQLMLGNGVTGVRYTEDDLVQLDEPGANRVVLLNANATFYNVGETISCGTARGNISGFDYRVISGKQDLGNGTTALIFDGEPADLLTTYKVYQAGQRAGGTVDLTSSSGTAIGVNGRASVSYRGIEDLFGNVYEWIDGALINDHLGYVCTDPTKYADTLTSDYEALGYLNAQSDGYAGEMGYDTNYPFAEFTVELGGGTTTKQCDYYYQNTGLRASLVGGAFIYGADAGLRSWYLAYSPSGAGIHLGSRLLWL